MNILSCDTSTEVMHVCFARFEEGKKPFYEARVVTSANQHSEMLVPSLLEVCQHNTVKLNELDLLVCTCGPGSFTGLRIAMSNLKHQSCHRHPYGCHSYLGSNTKPATTRTLYQACSHRCKEKAFYTACFKPAKADA